MSKVNENVAKLAEELKNKMILEGDKVTLPSEAYSESLPEGIDIETVEKIHGHDADYLAAAAKGFGEVSIEAMKKDEGLQQTTFNTNVVKDTVKGTFNRTYDRMTGIPKDGEEPKKEKAYGQLTMGWSKKGTKGSQGALKKVRDQIGEWAAESLGK